MERLGIKRASTHFIRGLSTESQLLAWDREMEHYPQAAFAFVGRSNVGKSSLINALFGNGTAKVAKRPGKTIELNIFRGELSNGDGFLFYDLPGHGYAKVAREIRNKWEGLFHQFFLGRNQSFMLIEIQDARHPLQDSDRFFYRYIKNFYFPQIVVLNKIDKIKRQKDRHLLDVAMADIFKERKQAKQIHRTSTVSKEGLLPLELALCEHILQQKSLVPISLSPSLSE